MSRAAATELLDVLDPLPYPQRMRHLAARARESAARNALGGLLDGLEQHGTYGQRLAVIAACAGQDSAYLSARLGHPDPVVRGHAQRAALAAPAGIPDDALADAVQDAPAAVRGQLLRTVVTGGRTALAERLIDGLRAHRGDAEAARLLPGCGTETAGRLLPELFHAVTGWRALSSRHPDAVLAEAERQLDALPEVLREDWWYRYGAGVAHTARHRPLRVLDLLERHARQGPLSPGLWRRLDRLAAADAGRTLRLLLAPEQATALRERGLTAAVLRRLVRAEAARLPELGRVLGEDPHRFAALLRAVPPSRRSAFYDAVTEGEDVGQPALDDEVLDALPHSRRTQEARRMARQARERRAHWSTVLAAVAHLPDEEAREELAAATARTAPEDRALAWQLSVRQAGYAAVGDGGGSGRVTALLADLERLRDEPDAVRSAALAALACLPPRLFGQEAAGHLDRIASDAIRAADSSPGTRDALARLAQALLREHAAGGERDLVGWALRTTVRLYGHTGGTDLGRLDRTLGRGREREVYEALRPWLEAGAEKVDHGLTFALARALGRRAAALPEVQELLWQAVQFGTEATARTAVGLWLREPRTRDSRTAQVLALDPSAAVLPAVSRTIALRRTDLLDVVLGDTPPYGRFFSKNGSLAEDAGPDGDSSRLPPVGPCTARWLPRQQRAAARLLAHEADDETRPLNRRRSVLARLVHVPREGARELRLWAEDTGEDEAELARAATAALVRTERPGEALPLLLAHSGDGRARTGAGALARASRYLTPSELSAALHGLLLSGLSADTQSGAPAVAEPGTRTAAVRLAATMLPVAEAAEVLAAVCELPGLHAEVRAACTACAPLLLDDERAWRVAAAAAHGAPALRQALLRTQPLELPERHRERYAHLVTALCDVTGHEAAEPACAALAHWAPWAPEAATVLSTAVTDLDNRRTWRQAAEGLVELVAALPAGAGTLEDVLTRLVTADADPDTPDAQDDRDRPARRRVAHLVLTLGRRAQNRRTARQTAGQMGVLLAGHEEFVPLAAQLLCASLDPEADAETLGRQLRAIAGLHSERPGLAWRTAGELRRILRPFHRPGADRERLLPVARDLAEDGGLATGLLAVTLAAALNPGSGWPGPWRAFLRDVRRHAVPDVRTAALEVVADPGE